MNIKLLSKLNAARAAKQRTALIRRLAEGHEALLVDDEVVHGVATDAEIELARDCLRRDQSRKLDGGELFIQVFNPPLRLFIIGAVHISQALAPMATMAGYDVTVIDPRGAFATGERFPDIALNDEWPDEALEELKPDRRSAIVALTHDPKIDDPALDTALHSEAFYVAALGSKRTHTGRLERLAALGHSHGNIAADRWTSGIGHRRDQPGGDRHIRHGSNDSSFAKKITAC